MHITISNLNFKDKSLSFPLDIDEVKQTKQYLIRPTVLLLIIATIYWTVVYK